MGDLTWTGLIRCSDGLIRRGVLGPGFRTVRVVLLEGFFLDGLFKFLEDVELFELGVRRHSNRKI